MLIDLMHWRHKGSHLHNNDASLVSRSAHVLCWQCALALSLSVRGPGRASPAVWLAGFAPLAACLAMTHVAVFRLTPNAARRPSVTSYAYGLFIRNPKKCFFSFISRPILIWFALSGRANFGTQNFYTEFWDFSPLINYGNLCKFIIKKKIASSPSFLDRFSFCLFYLIGLCGGFKTCTKNFEIQ